MLFKMIELPSDEPVSFVGCYVLKWGRIDEPTVAFREATPEEIAAEHSVQSDEKPCPLDHKELIQTGVDVCPECNEVTASRR